MDNKKLIDKLEHDLSHFMIEETCKNDPSKRGSPSMYKYKGLNISADTTTTVPEKTIKVRIGALEAEFKIDSGDKMSGALEPDDERKIFLWMNRNENHYYMKSLFIKRQAKKTLPIVPFDLEDVFEKD